MRHALSTGHYELTAIYCVHDKNSFPVARSSISGKKEIVRPNNRHGTGRSIKQIKS